MENKIKVGDWLIETRFGPIEQASRIIGALVKVIEITENFIIVKDYKTGTIFKNWDRVIMDYEFHFENIKIINTVEVILYAS